MDKQTSNGIGFLAALRMKDDLIRDLREKYFRENPPIVLSDYFKIEAIGTPIAPSIRYGERSRDIKFRSSNNDYVDIKKMVDYTGKVYEVESTVDIQTTSMQFMKVGWNGYSNSKVRTIVKYTHLKLSEPIQLHRRIKIIE